jgi:GrpB-like predicted nucleotidyltransferase (UPF0157 family)
VTTGSDVLIARAFACDQFGIGAHNFFPGVDTSPICPSQTSGKFSSWTTTLRGRLTFASLQAPIWEVLQGIALSVEHVGSTSVPGLAAKPIIDIDVVVPSRAQIPATVERLAAIGYVHSGDLGIEDRGSRIEDREAFKSPVGLPVHHLCACVQGCTALANHLTLREYLRRNPVTAAAYGRLKKKLAEQFPTDIESYIAGKTDFLLEVLRGAGFPETALLAVRNANRKT